MKRLLLVIIALSATAAHAQQQAPPLYTELTLKSARLAETRKLFELEPQVRDVRARLARLRERHAMSR